MESVVQILKSTFAFVTKQTNKQNKKKLSLEFSVVAEVLKKST